MSNAVWHSGIHFHFYLFLLVRLAGCGDRDNFNFLEVVCKSKEALLCRNIIRAGISLKPVSLLGSRRLPSLSMICPRYLILFVQKSHFTAFTLNPNSRIWAKTFRRSLCSAFVLLLITISSKWAKVKSKTPSMLEDSRCDIYSKK